MQKSTVFPAAYFADLVALLEKGLETTIKNDKGGGEKGGEKGGGGFDAVQGSIYIRDTGVENPLRSALAAR